MEKFTDVLKKEFHNSVNSFYVGSIYNPNMKEPPKTINNLDVLKEDDLCYFDFLNELPQERYLEVSKVVWRFIFNYEIGNDLIKKENEYIKQSKGKNSPKDFFPTDLKNAKNFKELITKIFQTNSKGTNIMGYTQNDNNTNRINRLIYSKTKNVYDKKSYNIDDLFEIVDLIIDDFETKEFKFIGKNIYYEKKEQTNGKFKTYLRKICKESKIKNYENDIRYLFQKENKKEGIIKGLF